MIELEWDRGDACAFVDRDGDKLILQRSSNAENGALVTIENGRPLEDGVYVSPERAPEVAARLLDAAGASEWAVVKKEAPRG